MCISPDQMTSPELEREIQRLREYCDAPHLAQHHDYYRRRADQLEIMLKERADSGTY